MSDTALANAGFPVEQEAAPPAPTNSLFTERGRKVSSSMHKMAGDPKSMDRFIRDLAKDKDVRIGGGVSTIRQYLAARLIDDMHIAMSPILLGRGESLFAGLDLPALGYRVTDRVSTERATHLTIERA